jgi:hypothetical protein
MNPPAARSIGIDFGASACRIAVQAGAETAVAITPAPPGVEPPKRYIGMQRHGNDAQATAILHCALEAAEREYRIRITGAIVAVPPCFTDRQKSALKACAEAAGVEKVGLVDEPLAAAVAHMGSGAPRGHWLIYGLGKATFYATLLDVSQRLEVRAHCGDVSLGGVDFDNLLVAELCRRGGAAQGEALPILAERCKKLLSFWEKAIVQDLAGPDDCPVSFEFARSEFELMIEPTVHRSIDLVRSMLSEQKIGGDGIRRVLLLGGSSRIPLVEREISILTSAEVDRLPGDAVCRGAAILASQLGACFEPATAQLPSDSRAEPGNRLLAAYAVARKTAGPDQIERYKDFLNAAHEELAYVYRQQAAIQDGLGRGRDAKDELLAFRDRWRPTLGTVAINEKLAQMYYDEATEFLEKARIESVEKTRRTLVKSCKWRLREALQANPRHEKAGVLLKGLGG